MHIKINGFLLNKSLIKWNNPFLPEFAFARVFYYINGKGARQLQLPKHRNVASEVKLGQVKNLMNFCKTSTRENRKARRCWKPHESQGLQKQSFLQPFFHLLKHWHLRLFQITGRLTNPETFSSSFRVSVKSSFQRNFKRGPPSLSPIKSSLAHSLWEMVSVKTLQVLAVNAVSVFLAKQVWPRGSLWLLFGCRSERRKKLSQQRDSDGSPFCPGREMV